MKKTISMILASALAISAAVPVFAEDSFKDLSETGAYNWSYQYVEDMAKKGFISGYDDGTFRAGNSVSRLEAFALFARLMGSNNAVNEAAVNAAKIKYKDVLEKYELSYAEGDVAFMMYRGVLREDELDTYFKDDKKKEAMPRYEAAVLITKAMLGEAEATSEVLTDLEYSDVKDMPDESKQYVYYVTKKGIMSGMGDGEFSPNTAVLRGQAAVMMSNTINAVNYEFETAKIESVDTSKNSIKIEAAADEIIYDDAAKIYVSGDALGEEALEENQNAVLTFAKDGDVKKLVFIDILADDEDINKEIEGIYRGYKSVDDKLYITVEDVLTEISAEYECAEAAAEFIDELANSDFVKLTVENGLVTHIDTMNQVKVVSNAVIKEINPMGTIKISHETEDLNGKSYTLSNKAIISKNGESASFWELYEGLSVDFSLEYGFVTKIDAVAEITSVDGVLSSYTISENPIVTVVKDGNEKSYDVSSNAEIMYNEKSVKLQELELGAVITLVIENNLVNEISAASPEELPSADSLTGVVKEVSQRTNVIMISYEDGEAIEYIVCGEDTKFYVVPTLNEYSLSQIKVGDTIVAYGEYSADRFICTGVTVSPSK